MLFLWKKKVEHLGFKDKKSNNQKLNKNLIALIKFFSLFSFIVFLLSIAEACHNKFHFVYLL